MRTIKVGIGLRQKIFDGDLTSICRVYKEKMVKHDAYIYIPKNVASIQIQKVAIFDSNRKKINLIQNKSFRYYNF